MDIEKLIAEGQGVFRNLKIADITSEDMLEILNSIDELKSVYSIRSNVTMMELYNYCFTSSLLSYVIKELLVSIYFSVFGANSEQLELINDAVSEYSNINDRLMILKSYVFIDGVNADGISIDEAAAYELRKKLGKKNGGTNKPERSVPAEETMYSENDYAAEKNDEVYEDSVLPYEEEIAEPQESMISLMENDMSDNFEWAGETEIEPADYTTDDTSFESETVFDPTILPRNTVEAANYYYRLKDEIGITEAQSSPDIYYGTSIDNKVSEGAGISSGDDIKITVNIKNDNIASDFMMLINDEGQLAVLGSFLESVTPHRYYIEASEDNIASDCLKPHSSIYTLIFSNQAHTRFFSGTIRITCVQLEKSDKVLCVDFGTSNTTAGIYTDEGIRTVNFVDVTNASHPSSNLCPTLVYVKSINDIDPDTGFATDVDFLFGYEAKKVLMESGYDPEGDMFFEIKRWIITPNKRETIWDGRTNAYIRRRDIIKGYLRYILKCAENDMKCRFTSFHFSAPVKLKGNFIQVLKEYIFPADECYYVMEADESIDEGVAIVYNHISESIIADDRENPDNSGRHEDNIIIIDCGGGTTDMVSSHYSYEKTPTGYSLDLETKFENGNSNFGGNNLTYRIFQLLKIKLASYYTNGSIGTIMADDFINPSQNDVLNEVDRCVNARQELTIYKKLDDTCRKCEEILPTDFSGDSEYAMETNTRHQVKRNFYFLWQLAEEIKIRFFTYTSTVEITLDDQKETVIPVDVSNIYYYIKNPEGDFPPLVSTKDMDISRDSKPVNITVNEINMLIRPDIYYLLSNIFQLDSDNFDENNYSKVKLSGQSCKISLFQDLLKEFVPGRKLRSGKISDYSSIFPKRLKMDCVNGCIAYVRDRNYHLIEVNNIPVSQNLIYNVRMSRGIGDQMGRTLFEGADFRLEDGVRLAKPLHIEPFSPTKGQFRLTVINTVGSGSVEHHMDIDIEYQPEKRIFLDENDSARYSGANGKTLKEKLLAFSYNNINDYLISDSPESPGVVDDIISRIREYQVEPGKSTVLVFAVPNNEGYGFVLYQIIKAVSDSGEECYYEACWKQIPFDSGVMSKSFFTGRNCYEPRKDDTADQI